VSTVESYKGLLMNGGEALTVVQTERIGQQPKQPGVEQNAPVDAFWILFGLSFVAIIPFWTVRYPVVTDYPNHLARWFVLFHMKDATYHFASFYAPAWGPLPYISPDILSMVLQHFLPIDIVGRCILSLCIILVAFATYFFLKKACPENVGLASFGILVAFNPNLLMGSISNEFSLAFCLLVVGLWVSYCRDPKAITAVGIVIGLLLVYFSHLSGFVVAGLVMGIYALFQEQRWKKLGVLAALSLPPLLILAYSPSHAGSGASFLYGGHVVSDKLKHLVFPVRLYTSATLDLIVLAGLAFLAFLVLKKRPTFTWQSVWLAVCATLLLAYFAAPGQYGFGGYIDTRFIPFVYLFLLAAIRFDRVPRYLHIGLALLVLFRIATVEQMFISHQSELRQLTASFEAIPRNAKVLPLVRWPENGLVGAGDMHHIEYGVIQRGFLDPELFHLQGVQPITLVGRPYCPNVFCDASGASQVDWQEVANSYDYLSVVHSDPEITTFTSRIGDAIFSNDAVTVYRVRHPQL
jgi:hypothetical protein